MLTQQKQLLIYQARDYIKDEMIKICDRENILLTYHNNLPGLKIDDGYQICYGEYRRNKNGKEIRLLNNYELPFNEITSFAHEIGHYFIDINKMECPLEQEEDFCKQYFLILLNKCPAWVIIALKPMVIAYHMLPEELEDISLYMEFFNIQLEDIEKSYINNKDVN